jgi:amino acid permease
MFPMSIPRKINSLRFTSVLGVFCGLYLTISVTIIFLTDRGLVPNPIDNIKLMKTFNISAYGIFSTMPLIIFACMYQFNVPIIYKELRNKTTSRMTNVIIRAMCIATTSYIVMGFFGYATFADNVKGLETENILDAPY